MVKTWKWEDDQISHKNTFEGHQLGIVSTDINKTGTLAASSSLDSHIRIWDLEQGKQVIMPYVRRDSTSDLSYKH